MAANTQQVSKLPRLLESGNGGLPGRTEFSKSMHAYGSYRTALPTSGNSSWSRSEQQDAMNDGTRSTVSEWARDYRKAQEHYAKLLASAGTSSSESHAATVCANLYGHYNATVDQIVADVFGTSSAGVNVINAYHTLSSIQEFDNYTAYIVSICELNGVGTQPNVAKATARMRALANSFTRAKAVLAECYIKVLATSNSTSLAQKATALLQEALEAKDDYAQLVEGDCYLNGCVLAQKPDLDHALSLYQQVMHVDEATETPRDATVLKTLASLRCIEILKRREDHQTALKVAKGINNPLGWMKTAYLLSQLRSKGNDSTDSKDATDAMTAVPTSDAQSSDEAEKEILEYLTRAGTAGLYDACIDLSCAYGHVDYHTKVKVSLPLNHAKADEFCAMASKQGGIPPYLQFLMLMASIRGTPPSYAESLLWKAANAGIAQAYFILGKAYLRDLPGFGQPEVSLPENRTKAFECFSAGTAKGDLDCECALARSYNYGWGVHQDSTKAFRHYEAAAKRGHARAINGLGTCYENGFGVTSNMQKAFELYMRSARLGSPIGENNLARMYFNAIFVPKSRALGIYNFMKSALQDYSQSMYHLALAYLDGEAVIQSPRMAIKLLRRSADHNYDKAQTRLQQVEYKDPAPNSPEGMYIQALQLYESASRRTLPSLVGAILELLEKSAEGLYPDACLTLALNYAGAGNALGCEIDLQLNQIDREKIHYYVSKLKQTQRSISAHHLVEFALAYGGGTSSSIYTNEALDWLRQAAENGFPRAYYLLGKFYLNDPSLFGYPEIRVSMAARPQALEYFIKGATYYDPACIGAAGYLQYQKVLNQPPPRDSIPGNVFDQCVFGEQQQDSWAVLTLGLCYEYGAQPNISQAVSKYQAALEMGNGQAAYHLAKVYSTGQSDILQDNQRILQLLEKGVKLGNAACQYMLAEALATGQFGVEVNESRAYELYLLAAQQGHGNATIKYLQLAEKREFEPREKLESYTKFTIPAGIPTEKVLEYAIEKAEAGDSQACYFVGASYEFDITMRRNALLIPKDEAKAQYFFKKGAELGNVACLCCLARSYVTTGTTTYNAQKGRELYLQCASKGYPRAFTALGMCFTLEGDNASAAALYQRAYALGCPVSAHIMGRNHSVGQCGAKKDLPRAMQLFNESIEGGCLSNYYILGSMYEKGKLVPPSKEQAFTYYRDGAQLHCPASSFGLARCYEQGIGTEVNKELAMQWYKTAAELGSVQAQFEYGKRLAEDGKSLDEGSESFRWIMKAAQDGYAEAQAYLARHYKSEEKLTEAFRWTYRAALQNVSESIEQLIEAYSNGHGVAANLEEQQRWQQRLQKLRSGNSASANRAKR